MIIGLAGYKESGKDETGKILTHCGFERLAFADPLRAEAEHWARLMQWPPEMPDDIYMETLGIEPAEIYAKPTSTRARRLLQWWGGDFRRGQDPSYWIDKAAARVRIGRDYCVTDVRYANEAEWVWSTGGCVWLIDRPGFTGDDHSSEQLPPKLRKIIRAKSGSPHDRIILNNQDLSYLARTARIALGEIRGH